MNKEEVSLDDCDSELYHYNALYIVDVKMDPLMFYQNNSHLKVLYSMAEKYFSITASSTPSERGFSAMGRIISKLRSNLKPETAGTLLFLKENTDLW